MGRAFNPRELLVELQENVLCEFFGSRAVPHKAQCDAEHHRLVILQNRREIELRALPCHIH